MILCDVSCLGVLLCVCAAIFLGHVTVFFVQPVMSQAGSGVQHRRISQCAWVFVFECVVCYSFGSSLLVNVCYDVGCVAVFRFVFHLDGLSQRRVGLSYALRVSRW